MATSIMTHNVKSVKTNGVSYHNGNAITLDIECADTDIDLTLFGLSTDAADHIDRCLNPTGRFLSEEAIRADERRKIADKLGLGYGPFPDANTSYTLY